MTVVVAPGATAGSGTRPAAAGHIPNVIDTNGNGVLDEGWVAANEPVDPTKDIKVSPGHAYSVILNTVDGSVWISYSVIPGVLTRYDPETQLSEVHEVPYMDDTVSKSKPIYPTASMSTDAPA